MGDHGRPGEPPAGSNSLWRWWPVVPCVASAMAIAGGLVSIVSASRSLEGRDPRSIDGLDRGIAGIAQLFGLACIGIGVVFAVGARWFLRRPVFNRDAQSFMWGSLTALVATVPWIGNPYSSKFLQSRIDTAIGVWFIGGFALVVGAIWSTFPEFRNPWRRRWWYATWLPWVPPLVAFVVARAIAQP
jgi:hypothetical protein